MTLFSGLLTRTHLWTKQLLTSKCLLAMKLTIVLLTAAALQVCATGFSQTVTISLKNAPLQKVFSAIEKQTGYTFLYTDQMLENIRPVDITLKDVSLQFALDICFRDLPLGYSIVTKTIILKPKEKPQLDPGNEEKAPPVIDITGRVTDQDGNSLVGATVAVKGSKILITKTGSNGDFILRGVEETAIIEVSYAEFESVEIQVNGRTTILTSLKRSDVELQEVIINKGYYTEKQKTSVSNVSTITAKDIEKQPVQNVLLALQARVPGLTVTQNSGTAGGSVKIRIQGENSILSGNDPLYVVDGVPIDAQLPRTGNDWMLGNSGPNGFGGWGNPLNYLNPLDIESVEILKDADATAIYGSRAANGAILITTKKGKAGAMKLELNMQTGWGRLTRRMDMMNTRQYLDMRYEAFKNDGIDWTSSSVSANDLKLWDTTRYTNWQDELLGGTAHYNDINASVSGGSPNMRYLVSGTYHKETTVFPLPKDFADQKAAVHFNLNANNNNQKFRMQFSGNYMFDDNKLPQVDFTAAALMLEPNAPQLLNTDGSINWAPDAVGNTTLGDLNLGSQSNIMTGRYLKYVNKTHNLVSSLKLDYTILPGLTIGSSFGFNYMQTNDFSPSPLIAVAPEQRAATQRAAAFGNRNIQSWIIEPQAGYHTTISKGSLDLLFGTTFQHKKAGANSFTGTGQLSDDLLSNINAASVISNGYYISTIYRYNAFFGRASYNWDDRYILTMNARRDGSTRFGVENRFNNFASVGAAWLFSNENFIKSYASLISFGKLRGSYGTTGNDQIGDYQFMSLYSTVFGASVPYQGIVGLEPINLPNPNLQWEKTQKLQFGLDLGLLQDRLIVNTNYVRNRSSNQLLPYRLPSPTGYSSYTTNFPATVQNRNWEFLLTVKIIQNKNFSWTSSGNLTIPKNKLIAFPGLDNSTHSAFLTIGQPIDAYAFYHWQGVSSGTGDNLYADQNGHLTLMPNDDDRSVLISKFPKFYGGFDNTITYKGIQLYVIFQFVKNTGYNDAIFWNTVRYPGMFAAGVSNQPVAVLNQWQKPGDNGKSVARFSNYADRYVYASDHRFTDISYISLKNVSLSWDLPQKWASKMHFRNLRLYMHGQNLLTISNYKGLNPETQSMTVLPPLQVWTVGVMLGL